MLLLVFDFHGVDKQVKHACRHNYYRAELTYSTCSGTHAEREDGTAEEAHNHEARNLVALGGSGDKGL